jgi:hypothetical protein
VAECAGDGKIEARSDEQRLKDDGQNRSADGEQDRTGDHAARPIRIRPARSASVMLTAVQANRLLAAGPTGTVLAYLAGRLPSVGVRVIGLTPLSSCRLLCALVT